MSDTDEEVQKAVSILENFDMLEEAEKLKQRATQKKLPIDNLPPDGFIVGGRGDKIAIMAWNREITKDQALNLAAWLVALADPGRERFEKIFNAVCNT